MPNQHRPGYFKAYYLNVTKPRREALKRSAWEFCWGCGSPFLPTRSDNFYHSPACRKRASRARLASKE